MKKFIYKIYYLYYSNKKKINKAFIILCVAYDIYLIINNLFNDADLSLDMLLDPFVIFVVYLLISWCFHKLIGQYWLLSYQTILTKDFQRDIMDKNIKAAGKRRGYKDTIQSGMTTNFVACSKEQIKKQIEEMDVHLFYFNLKKVDKYIKENLEIFNVADKNKKIEKFLECVALNGLFLKDKYKHLEEEIMDDYNKTKSNIRLFKSDYIISDSINFTHLINLLYDYFYLKWRLEIDVWIISNQPCFQYYDYKTKKYKMARIFSPDLKATKPRHVKVKEDNKMVEYVTVDYMLAEDWICFWESESDIWWNNIDSDVKKNIEERGIRWWENIQGHIMGEHILSLRNGQVAGRTVKIQRDLEESFYSVTRAVKVYGGSKRIFFIKFWMFLNWWYYKLHPKKKSKLHQKIKQLQMSGWLKLETVFSRTESINYQAPGITLQTLLDKEKELYMSQYQTTLVFRIRDCWGKYNTHYLEYVAEKLAVNSEASLLNLPVWDPDLKLKDKHIAQMNYDTVDIFNIPDDVKYKNNSRYKKVEKDKTTKTMGF